MSAEECRIGGCTHAAKADGLCRDCALRAIVGPDEDRPADGERRLITDGGAITLADGGRPRTRYHVVCHDCDFEAVVESAQRARSETVGHREQTGHDVERAPLRVRATDDQLVTDGSGREESSEGTAQATLRARPKRQVVEADRNDERRLMCPDCGALIGKTRGGHDLPDGRRVHGWACPDCNNVIPGRTHGPEAETWTDKIRGEKVEFRDGSDRWVAVIDRGESDG